MRNRYKVLYTIKTAQENRGEFSPEQYIQNLAMYAVTNDLNELFTDIFFAYRDTGIIGIEITGVEDCADYL